MINFVPFKIIKYQTSISILETTQILTKITERGNKPLIDLTKISKFEGNIRDNSFEISRGTSSLTLGKFSGTPIFKGSLYTNKEGGTNFKVVVKLNLIGGVIIFSVFFILLSILFDSWNTITIGGKFPLIILTLSMYISIMLEFNNSVEKFNSLLNQNFH